MYRGLAMLLVALIAVLAAGLPRAGAQNKEECKETAGVKVEAAYKLTADQQRSSASIENPATLPKEAIRLKDTIEVRFNKGGLTGLLAELDCRKKDKRDTKLALFLGSKPVKGLEMLRTGEPDVVRFELIRTSESKDAFNQILSRPGLELRDVVVSVGFEDRSPLNSNAKIKFDVLPGWYLTFAGGFLLAIAAAFWWCVKKTNIVRDTPLPQEDAANAAAAQLPAAPPAYSMSKSQAAWWFFVILASYLFIAVITGDYSGTLNNTALILLGIGATAAVGAAIMDATSDPAKEVLQREAGQQNAANIKKKETELKEKPTAAADDPAAAAKIANLKVSLIYDKEVQKRLTGRSVNFLQDILSDVNGVSFYRFQMAAWTVVLSFIFLKDVYEKLAMPDFDATLLLLQGISAGTYLGIRRVEPTVPRDLQPR